MEAESAGSSPPRPRLRTHITSSLFPVAATATTTDAASAADDAPPNEHTGGHSMAPPGLTAFLKQMQQNQMQQQKRKKGTGPAATAPFPVQARYANSQGWEVPESNDKETELLYFRVVKDVVAREGALLRLRLVISNIEGYYWKYALLCVKAADRKQKRQVKEEQLVSKRIQIRKLQTEISVAIAHVRGASVAVLESVVAWRERLAHSRSTKTVQTVSVFWEGVNYLHKMAVDLREACECPTMRLWMGFEPNPLMLPPTHAGDPRGYDPQAQWEAHHYAHFNVWMEKRTAWILKLEKAQRLEMKKRRGELNKGGGGAGVGAGVGGAGGGENNRSKVLAMLENSEDNERQHEELLRELIPNEGSGREDGGAGRRDSMVGGHVSVGTLMLMKKLTKKVEAARDDLAISGFSRFSLPHLSLAAPSLPPGGGGA